jgi:hypothetical protein
MTLNNINEILNSIQKNLKAPKDKENKFGNFVYRNAEGILEAYKEEISKDIYPNDLTLTHSFKFELIGIRLFVFCTSKIELSDGTKKEADGFAEIDVSKKGMDQSQLSGAVTSYAKKYALCNLFAIDDSKDDPDADEKPRDNKGFFKEPSGAMKNIAKEADGEIKSKAEEERLNKLAISLAAMGSIEEIDGYLQERGRLKVLMNMSEINAAQAKMIIKNAKLAIDPEYKGE